jgi:hypothetical protein
MLRAIALALRVINAARAIALALRVINAARYRACASRFVVNACTLLLRFHCQVRFFVFVITARVFVDTCHLFVTQMAFHPGRHTENETSGRYLLAFGDDGAGAHDRILTDDDVVQERGAHSDQAMRFHCAPMQHYTMANRDIIPENKRAFVPHHMPDRRVLNVRVMANANDIHVTSNHAVIPNARVIPDFHVANDLGAFSDVNSLA